MFDRLRLATGVRRGLLPAFVALACAGSSIPKFSVEDLVVQSEMIVSGTVTRSWTGWDGEHRFIWTHTEIRVNEALRGAPHGVVTVSEPGGSADGLMMQVPGSTAYSVGERVNVFLYRTPLGYMRTVGYGQGKFVLSTDRRFRSAAFAGQGGAILEGLSPEQFRSSVLQAIAKQAGGALR